MASPWRQNSLGKIWRGICRIAVSASISEYVEASYCLALAFLNVDVGQCSFVTV